MARSFRRLLRRSGESGTTYIEIAIITVIVTISLMAMTNAIRVATRGAVLYKERTRALAIAQDKMEQVKRMGYDSLKTRVSRYQWPTIPDPAAPLSQAPNVIPYPVPAPLPGEDPWSVEPVLAGLRTYYRHVKIKCVEEAGGVLQQKPTYAESPPGGTDTSSNLMQIEVDVTWFSKANWQMQQARITGLLANTRPPVVTEGRISGTVFNAATGLPLTGKKLVVYTTNLGTGDSFSDLVDAGKGTYTLYPLPLGQYIVKLAGAPEYYDSAHGTGAIPVPPGAIEPITIDAGNLSQINKGIYTKPAVKVRIAGLFVGAVGGVDYIVIDAGDGVSSTTEFTVDSDCTAANPCSFALNNVAWAVSGTKQFRVNVTNKTKGRFGYGMICMDETASVSATTFYWGYDQAPPFLPGPTPYVVPTCGACGAVPCQNPAKEYMLSATAYSGSGASVRVFVQQYYNATVAPLPGARVYINDGNSGTQVTDSSGYAGCSTCYITGVKSSLANAIKVKAWMSTTGYTTDEWVLSFDVVDGGTYDLTVGSSGDPGTDQKHNFVLKKVSSVSGTTWKVCDGGSPPCGPASEGMGGVTVSLVNNQTGFSQVVTTDSGGKFLFPNVPMETYDYTLVPSGGGDMLSNPIERLVKVGANGFSIRTDSSGLQNQFVLTVVNGIITGRVMRGGVPYGKGAVVFATTYGGTFPSTLPSGLLAASHTYSAITETDGTYTLKVATGVGNYTVHVFTPDNPTAPVTVSVSAGQPAAGATVTAPDAVIP